MLADSYDPPVEEQSAKIERRWPRWIAAFFLWVSVMAWQVGHPNIFSTIMISAYCFLGGSVCGAVIEKRHPWVR